MNSPKKYTEASHEPPHCQAQRHSARDRHLCCICTSRPFLFAQEPSSPIGVFEGHQDVGTVLHPGSAKYESANERYTISGSGEKMWFGIDDFHFVWKKVTGDVALSADISFVGDKGNNHRKAVLMIRQSLDGNSALRRHSPPRRWTHISSISRCYRCRRSRGAIQCLPAPKRMRLEKRGDNFYAFVTGKDGQLEPSGASTKLSLTGPFYVGIGVSATIKMRLKWPSSPM